MPFGGGSAVSDLVVSPVTCAAALGTPVPCGVVDHTRFSEGEYLLRHTGLTCAEVKVLIP